MRCIRCGKSRKTKAFLCKKCRPLVKIDPKRMTEPVAYIGFRNPEAMPEKA